MQLLDRVHKRVVSMRIALISFIENRTSTGMGRWTHEMGSALEARGHQVELWFNDRFPLAGVSGPRASVLLVPLALAFKLMGTAQTYDAVVVHEPIGFWCALLRRVLPRMFPAVVCMCHNVESRTFRDMRAAARRGQAEVGFASWLKGGLLRRWQSDGAIRLADAVVVLSTVDLRYVVTRLGVQTDHVFRLINGAESVKVELRGDPLKVLFVGGWLDVKGRRLLPDLVRQVLESMPAVRFTLAGTGKTEAEIMKQFGKARPLLSR